MTLMGLLVIALLTPPAQAQNCTPQSLARLRTWTTSVEGYKAKADKLLEDAEKTFKQDGCRDEACHNKREQRIRAFCKANEDMYGAVKESEGYLSSLALYQMQDPNCSAAIQQASAEVTQKLDQQGSFRRRCINNR